MPQPYYTVESATALMMVNWDGLTRPVSSAAIIPIDIIFSTGKGVL